MIKVHFSNETKAFSHNMFKFEAKLEIISEGTIPLNSSTLTLYIDESMMYNEIEFKEEYNIDFYENNKKYKFLGTVLEATISEYQSVILISLIEYTIGD
jgi:hypothetical protein